MLSNSGPRAANVVADQLRDRADCLARLGLVNEAATDRYVSSRLRDRAVSDRIEAGHLWRSANVTNTASEWAVT